MSTFASLTNKFERLRELIGLELVHNQVADIPPVRDYEFYIQLFGKGGRTQVNH